VEDAGARCSVQEITGHATSVALGGLKPGILVEILVVLHQALLGCCVLFL
jgi:hypothetical protein